MVFQLESQNTAALLAWFAEYDGRAVAKDADVMVKSAGERRFTSMIQGGWGDILKEFS